MRAHASMFGLVASAAAFGLPPALAGTFAISPLRVELSQQAATAALTVRNEDSAPVVVQAEALSWSQAAGEDALEPTRELLVSPAVFTVPANGSQLVRVALRRPADTTQELSYRLVLQEVPQQASPDFTGMQVALRLSLPVFVAPQQPAAPRLDWSATRAKDGRLVVRADNTGSGHTRVLSFTVTPADAPGEPVQQSVATYVLPGQFRTWTLEDKNNDRDDNAGRSDRFRLKGQTERGEIVAELSLAR